MKQHNGVIVVFLGPAVLCFALVFFYPVVRTFLMSFFYVPTVTDRLVNWEYVGFTNYSKLFQSKMFVQSLLNIFNIWLWGGIAVFTIALFFATLLTSGYRGKSFYRAAIYLPNVVSAVAMATMWIQYAFNSKYGLFHTVFSLLGLDTFAAFQWTSPDNQFLAMTIAYSFGMVGYFLLIFMAGMEKIPSDYYEAATIEGASIGQRFSKITLPLMRGVLKSGIVMWSVTSIAFFIWSMMFSPLDADVGTITPMVYMYNLVFGRNLTLTDPRLLNAGAGAAVGVLMTLLTIVIFALSNAIIRDKKVHY